MKIGYFCYQLSGTGPSTRARDIISAVIERTNHEVVVLTGEPTKVSQDAKTVRISPTRPGRAFKAVRRELSDADVVHVPINLVQVFFVRLGYRGPLVAGVGPGIQTEWLYRQLGRFLDIDVKIKVHESSTLWEDAGYRTRVCTATIDEQLFYPYEEDHIRAIRAELGIPVDSSVYLYVGELKSEQGAELVLELAESTLDDELVIAIGDGPLRGRFETSPHIRYEGFVDNEQLPKYYNIADVTLGPREHDVTSNVGLESIATGTPFITTADGLIRDLFEERGTYVWADRTSDDVLSTARQLIDDEDVYQAQRECGLETISEMSLTLETALKIHLDLYEELSRPVSSQ